MIFTFGNNVYLQRLNGVTYAWCLFTYRTVYVLLVLGSNCECVDGTSTKLWMRCLCGDRCGECVYKTWHWKFISRYLNVCAATNKKYKYNKGTKMSSTGIAPISTDEKWDIWVITLNKNATSFTHFPYFSNYEIKTRCFGVDLFRTVFLTSLSLIIWIGIFNWNRGFFLPSWLLVEKVQRLFAIVSLSFLAHWLSSSRFGKSVLSDLASQLPSIAVS